MKNNLRSLLFSILRSTGHVLLICMLLSPLAGQTDEPGPVPITFESKGYTLMGRFFDVKEIEQTPTIILLHGFPGNEQDVLGLGQRLARAGIQVITFNYSGTHRSEGEYSMENTLCDIRAAYDYLHRSDIISKFHIDTTRIVLGGYSFGGGMAMTYAARHPEIRQVISIAGTDHGEFAREYVRNPQMARQMDSLFDKLKAPDGPIHFEGSNALRKLAAHPDPVDLRLSAGNLADRDLLLIGGWDDEQVTIDHHLIPLYRALKKAGAANIRFVAYQTDHSFRNVRDELADQIVQWILAERVNTSR